MFDVYGPLDWKRADLLIARVNQFQAVGSDPLKDFVLFRDPTERPLSREERENEILAKFGWTDETDLRAEGGGVPN